MWDSGKCFLQAISIWYGSPNRVNHVFGHISAKNHPTVCFFGLHMLFCHPGHFLFYDLHTKSDSFTSKAQILLKMLHFRKCPNMVNHVFGHISAKNYPTVCFLGLHMLFCHPGHFLFYDLHPKSDSFTSKSQILLKMPHFQKCPNRVNSVFGHILAKNYPTVCFLGLHMLFCELGHFFLYDLQLKRNSFTSKSQILLKILHF